MFPTPWHLWGGGHGNWLWMLFCSCKSTLYTPEKMRLFLQRCWKVRFRTLFSDLRVLGKQGEDSYCEWDYCSVYLLVLGCFFPFHLWTLDETADLLKGLVNNTNETFLAVQTAWRKKVRKAGSTLHRQCMKWTQAVIKQETITTQLQGRSVLTDSVQAVLQPCGTGAHRGG